jgi:hypothetical protein
MRFCGKAISRIEWLVTNPSRALENKTSRQHCQSGTVTPRLDFQMPVLNGLDAASLIAKSAPKTVIINVNDA